MYIDLKITAEYGSQQSFTAKLIQDIGVNAISPHAAVQQSMLKTIASTVIPTVVAAEQIQNKVVALYFLQGRDSISVHIVAPTIVEIKQEAVRIEARVRKLFEDPAVKARVNAVIYTVNYHNFDTAIIYGSHKTRWARFKDAFLDRWFARLVTPGIIFAAMTAFLPGTGFVQSALIGFLAAAATLLIEGIVFASTADEWTWEGVGK